MGILFIKVDLGEYLEELNSGLQISKWRDLLLIWSSGIRFGLKIQIW